ncbi:MAG TPA: TrkA C-terminal domain-containing protein [Limnochordia bacterium]|nr:TrkA C-terminal domain-containing protein [Limnochordia bacterium]
MIRWDRSRYERTWLILSRAITVGIAYVSTQFIPGSTSSFVAIFTSLLSFDLFVAMARPPLRPSDWEQFFEALRPRILSTAITLGKGVLVGAVIGICAILGLPYWIGAVLTSGLAYVWALNTRHAISTFVSVIAGLSLYERLSHLEAVETLAIVKESAAAIALSTGGTFTALVMGWSVGLLTGGLTRLFLSRPYRSLKSAAYELPLEMRPFNEVVHVGERSLVASATVEEGAPLAYRSLAESGLKEKWGTTILSIKRDGEEIVMPKGTTVLLPGDQVMLLTERDQSPAMLDQFRAQNAGEQADSRR